jgi:hypothetical protein
MGYSHYMRRNDIPRISASSFAECVVIWDFGRAHFPLNVQGAVVRLASGQFHHMLVRLLLISRLLVQALAHLWVHSLARSQISPSSRRLVPPVDASVGWSTDSHAVSSVGPVDLPVHCSLPYLLFGPRVLQWGVSSPTFPPVG